MSCVTCETTPPVERGSATRVHEGHVGVRFGDGGFGWQIVFNGRNVTLQTVEAVAGDHDTGWVELHLLTDEGAPRQHPGEQPTCPSCAEPWEPAGADPEMRDGLDWGACPSCGCATPPDDPAYGPHPVTVIRRGNVQVIHGTHILAAASAQSREED